MRGENAPEIHGDKVWFSSYFIMEYLEDNPLPKKAKVLEIGAGWGLLSIWCAKKFGNKCLAVDADKHVMPFVDLHAKENKVKVDTLVSKYEDIPADTLAKYDVMLGGDICFWESLVNPLYKTIKGALDNGVKTVVIADPGRSTFLKLAKKCQRNLNAILVSYAIIDPNAYDGYLLIIKR